MNHDLEKRIQDRAYALWVIAGRPDGRDTEFWVEAEREINPSENNEKCANSMM
jgi:hypothetical protein